MTAVALETESATCDLRRFNKKYPCCVVESGVCFPPALDFFKRGLEPSGEPPAMNFCSLVIWQEVKLGPLLVFGFVNFLLHIERHRDDPCDAHQCGVKVRSLWCA